VIYPLSRRGGRSKNVLADRSLNPHPHSEMFRSKRCPVSPCPTSMCPTISRPDRPRKRRRNARIAKMNTLDRRVGQALSRSSEPRLARGLTGRPASPKLRSMVVR
jgi:hypothetical protein